MVQDEKRGGPTGGAAGPLLARYLGPQRYRLLALTLVLLAGVGIQLGLPQVIRYYIDVAKTTGNLHILAVASIGFIAAALAGQGVSIAGGYFAEAIAWTVTNRLRVDLVKYCLKLDLSFHEVHPPGELIERLDGDVTTLASVASVFSGQVFANGVVIIGVIALLFREHVALGVAMTTFALLGLALLVRFRSVGVANWQAERQATADLSNFFLEYVSATEDMRANGATSYVLHKLPVYLRRQLRRTRSAWLVGSVPRQISILLYATAVIVAFGVGVALLKRHAITLGVLYLVFSYSETVMASILQLSDRFGDLQEAQAGLRRVGELFEARPSNYTRGGVALPSGPLPVAFEKITFGYEPNQPVLRDFSLTVPAGQVLGIVGRTGSGKTTLARLAAGLCSVDSGRVRVGNVDVKTADWMSLRSRVGLVTQEVQLLDATVRDNVTLFDPRFPDKIVEQALRTLGLGRWLDALSAGISTRLGGGVSGLSAGQAQLLALARILLRDPGLVILDEASSRLDPVTEARVGEAVDRILRGRTGIIIAHRLATLRSVDCVLIMQDGEVQEYGPRRELEADRGSRFSELLRAIDGREAG